MSRTILVVDDDEEFTTILNQYLTQQKYHVKTTTTLPTSKLLNHLEPDLILLDLWLNQQLNTSQFAKKVNQNRKQSQVILISSDITVTRYAKNLNLPALVKPFSLETLLQKISQTLN